MHPRTLSPGRPACCFPCRLAFCLRRHALGASVESAKHTVPRDRRLRGAPGYLLECRQALLAAETAVHLKALPTETAAASSSKRGAVRPPRRLREPRRRRVVVTHDRGPHAVALPPQALILERHVVHSLAQLRGLKPLR
jgi:hypothetical protein